MKAVNTPIFLDHHSTTPVDPSVLEKMLPYFSQDFGNPASRQHVFGWRAEAGVERARGQVAQSIGCDASEIIFTSGATESNNLALLGVAESVGLGGAHVITANTEHKAVLDPCKYLETCGARVTYLNVDRFGLVQPEQILEAICPETALISVMAANNEIGTLQPIAAIGKLAQAKGIRFHTDAAQAAGKIPLDVEELGIDLLSLSAHKFYGPKGVGALYVRKRKPRIRVIPRFYGGGHEKGLRSGTLNVAAIVGLGFAIELADRIKEEEGRRIFSLREKLFRRITEGLDGVVLNGHPAERLPNNLSLTLEGVSADQLMMEMKDVAISSGSACSSAAPEPSHVLRAIGLSEVEARSSIRIGLGRFNTEAEIDYAAGRIIETVKALRENPPLKKSSGGD